jgi:hypothetical protein
MNKAEWTDFFFYIKDLFKVNKSRKVEKSKDSSSCNQDFSNEDSYQKDVLKDCYGRKRKKYYDS